MKLKKFRQLGLQLLSKNLTKYDFASTSKFGKVMNTDKVVRDSYIQNAAPTDYSHAERVGEWKRNIEIIKLCLAGLIVIVYIVLVVVFLVPLAIAGYSWVITIIHILVFPIVQKIVNYYFATPGKQIVLGK